jgi:diguanylate cyclase (GGDEF)-like protein
MSAPESTSVPADNGASMEDLRASLRRLERRNWWLWGSAVLVMVLLAGNQASKGLLALVFLFSVFVVYQQYLIQRLRREVADKIGGTATAQVEAELFCKMATHDPLTGLYNRGFADQQLSVELSRARRGGYPFTLLMINIKGLWQINDLHGRSSGDQALHEFGVCIRKAIRCSDLAVRIAGDQFAVLLPDCDSTDVPAILERLRGLEVETAAGVKVPVAFAAGWVKYQPWESPQELMDRADSALQDNRPASAAQQQV